MKVLIACEESQAVCIAFRNRGHEAYSCDIQDCSGNHPEWHIKDDVLKIINDKWDLMIAHPPCTYLSYAGMPYWNKPGRKEKREEALEFFMKLYNAPINKICIENPLGYPSKFIKHTQVIQPFYFGDSYQKRTCLWLKNLPKLVHYNGDDLFGKNTHVSSGEFVYWTNKKTGKLKRQPKWYSDAFTNKQTDRQTARSKTFPRIANAMVEQWGSI